MRIRWKGRLALEVRTQPLDAGALVAQLRTLYDVSAALDPVGLDVSYGLARVMRMTRIPQTQKVPKLRFASYSSVESEGLPERRIEFRLSDGLEYL